MATSTDALLARLLALIDGELARGGAAASAPARAAGARPRRAAHGGDRRARRCRWQCSDARRHGTPRADRAGAGRRRWRCAPSSTACRCASARTLRSARARRDDARVRPRRAHGGARRAVARRARARRRAAGAAAGDLPAERGGLSLRRRAAGARAAARRARTGGGARGARPPGAAVGNRRAGRRARSTRRATRWRSSSRASRRTPPTRTAGATRCWRSRRSSSRCTRVAARRIDPLGPTVLNVGVLEGGGAENVIPARARARATIRALRAQDRVALRELVERGGRRHRRRARLSRQRRARCRASRRWRTIRRSSRGHARCWDGRGWRRRRSGARAARTTSPSSARSRPWRWRSSASTARPASRCDRCTIRNAAATGRGGGRGRARAGRAVRRRRGSALRRLALRPRSSAAGRCDGRYPPSGEGGMRGSPCTSGMRIISSSTKHHDQSSRGWIERMIGWPLERLCALA